MRFRCTSLQQASTAILTSDYTAMKRVSLVGFLIDAGVIAATLTSAMASLLCAPRILQSLAADRIFPFLVPFQTCKLNISIV